MRLGKWLTNVVDPARTDSRARGVMNDAEWRDHLRFIEDNVKGPPRATKFLSVKQLSEWGLIGIYEHTPCNPTNNQSTIINNQSAQGELK